jgi:small subunit ribosomal protein S6
MENLYCTIFIVDVSQNPEEVENVTSRIVQLIEDHGGSIKRNERWGKRRLAYPIRKRTSGFYVEIEFGAQSRLNIPQIIEGEYRINDRVLRYLTYVVTKEELHQRELNATRTQYYHDEEESDLEAETGASNEEEEKAPKEESPKKQPAQPPVKEDEPVAEETSSEEEKTVDEKITEEETQKEKTE